MSLIASDKSELKQDVSKIVTERGCFRSMWNETVLETIPPLEPTPFSSSFDRELTVLEISLIAIAFTITMCVALIYVMCIAEIQRENQGHYDVQEVRMQLRTAESMPCLV